MWLSHQVNRFLGIPSKDPFLLDGTHASAEAYEGRCGVAGRERLELAFGGPQQREDSRISV